MPHVFNRDETISTLRFATRTKLITNTVFKPQQMAKLIKNLKSEIGDLRQKLQDKVIASVDDEKDQDFAMEKSATKLDPAVQKQMIDDLRNYKEENVKLQQDQVLAKQLGGDMVCTLVLALADRLSTSTATLELWGALGVGIIEV